MKCIFCDNEAQTTPPYGAYYHLTCKDCGEYKISLAALSSLIDDAIKIKLSGMSFSSWYYDNKVIFFTTELINSVEMHEDVFVIEKLYYLTQYIYTETKKNGIGYMIKNIPNACCYAKDSSEQLELLKQLKELKIIEFELYENGSYCRIFKNTKLNVSAFMTFQNGIHSVEMFREAFMSEKRISHISIPNNSGNIAIGSGNTQSIMMNTSINEKDVIKELLNRNIEMEIIDKIRTEIKELAVEYNKNNVDEDRMNKIFKKLKTIGGNVLLSAFTFLSKPEVVTIIQGLKTGL